MLSRLIDIDPDVKQEPELKDYEFGCYSFETLPKAKGTAVGETLTPVAGVEICEINISYDNAENSIFHEITIDRHNFLAYRKKIQKSGHCMKRS